MLLYACVKEITMSLVGPWLNDFGSRKRKVKYASAEAKRRDLELKREWDEKMNNYAKVSKPLISLRPKSKLPKLVPPPGRETPFIPSHPITVGVAAKKAPQVYTGNRVIGISIVHKSCLQPVFSESEAKDFASMRR